MAVSSFDPESCSSPTRKQPSLQRAALLEKAPAKVATAADPGKGDCEGVEHRPAEPEERDMLASMSVGLRGDARAIPGFSCCRKMVASWLVVKRKATEVPRPRIQQLWYGASWVVGWVYERRFPILRFVLWVALHVLGALALIYAVWLTVCLIIAGGAAMAELTRQESVMGDAQRRTSRACSEAWIPAARTKAGAAMSKLSFGAGTAEAAWNPAYAVELPHCAQCGREAERKYPDQREEDVALPCSDGEGRDFCSRSCAIEFAFTLRRRCSVRGPRESPTELRRELNAIYEAAVVLANLSDEAIGFVEATDEGQGLLEITQTSEEDSVALESQPAAGNRFPAAQRFVDLKSLRRLADEFCRLLGGEEKDPKWLSGDPESRAAEEWLEGLVKFRTHSFSNEVWPLAEDLTRTQIAGLYAFYVAQSGKGPGNNAVSAAGYPVQAQ